MESCDPCDWVAVAAHATHVAHATAALPRPALAALPCFRLAVRRPLALLRPLLGADLFFERGGSVCGGPANAARVGPRVSAKPQEALAGPKHARAEASRCEPPLRARWG